VSIITIEVQLARPNSFVNMIKMIIITAEMTLRSISICRH